MMLSAAVSTVGQGEELDGLEERAKTERRFQIIHRGYR